MGGRGQQNRLRGPFKGSHRKHSLIPRDVSYLKRTENVLFSIAVILQEYVDWFAWGNSEFFCNFIHLCFQTWSQCAFLIVVTKIRNTSSQNKHSKETLPSQRSTKYSFHLWILLPNREKRRCKVCLLLPLWQKIQATGKQETKNEHMNVTQGVFVCF